MGLILPTIHEYAHVNLVPIASYRMREKESSETHILWPIRLQNGDMSQVCLK